MMSALNNIRLLDDLAKQETFIHNLHPVIKVITTVVYLAVVISFDSYELGRLLPFVFYPMLIFALGELPFKPILKRILLVEPFIIGIGILNPLFDQHVIMIGEFMVSRGWITFLGLVVKGSLTVTASILLIATTGMEKLMAALRWFKVPKIFVLQLLLTYRYMSLLIEEVSTMIRAYLLRAPNQRGIEWRAWGSFSGQLALRTFERAERIYEAMKLRGFTGEYYTGGHIQIKGKDYSYLIGWILFFITAKMIDIPLCLGSLLMGVIK